MGIRNKSYGLQQIVGRRIKAIVANERTKSPRVQLFLVFDDDSFYEFYGEIAATGGVDPGGEEKVLKYAARFPRTISRLPDRRSGGEKPDRRSSPRPGRRRKEVN